jgi:hypothetical protein
VSTQPQSVLSGRNLKQIAAEERVAEEAGDD